MVVTAVAAALLAWASPAIVAFLLWWVWAARRSVPGDGTQDMSSGADSLQPEI